MTYEVSALVHHSAIRSNMRSNLFAILVLASGFIGRIAALGINCQGSSFCKTYFNGMDYRENVISEFWEILNAGPSEHMKEGGPIREDALYKAGNPPWLACQPLPKGGAICLFLQGNVPAGGVTGKTLQDRIGDLVNHGCSICGSVPISGNNDPDEMGFMTANFVKSGIFCNGLC